MKLGFGNLILNEGKGTDCEVYSLVIAQTPWIYNNELIISSVPPAWMKDREVRKVQYGAALGVADRPSSKPFLPDMVCYNHMIRKGCRHSFHAQQHLDYERVLIS